MNNCLNVPGELLEAMLTMALQNMDPEDYQKKISGINWLNPKQAGPTWQVLISCFEQLAVCEDLSKPIDSIEKLLPVLKKYGLALAGYRIVRVS